MMLSDPKVCTKGQTEVVTSFVDTKGSAKVAFNEYSSEDSWGSDAFTYNDDKNCFASLDTEKEIEEMKTKKSVATKMVKCNNCYESVDRGDFKNHNFKVCPIKCRNCGRISTRSKIHEHNQVCQGMVKKNETKKIVKVAKKVKKMNRPKRCRYGSSCWKKGKGCYYWYQGDLGPVPVWCKNGDKCQHGCISTRSKINEHNQMCRGMAKKNEMKKIVKVPKNVKKMNRPRRCRYGSSCWKKGKGCHHWHQGNLGPAPVWCKNGDKCPREDCFFLHSRDLKENGDREKYQGRRGYRGRDGY